MNMTTCEATIDIDGRGKRKRRSRIEDDEDDFDVESYFANYVPLSNLPTPPLNSKAEISSSAEPLSTPSSPEHSPDSLPHSLLRSFTPKLHNGTKQQLTAYSRTSHHPRAPHTAKLLAPTTHTFHPPSDAPPRTPPTTDHRPRSVHPRRSLTVLPTALGRLPKPTTPPILPHPLHLLPLAHPHPVPHTPQLTDLAPPAAQRRTDPAGGAQAGARVPARRARARGERRALGRLRGRRRFRCPRRRGRRLGRPARPRLRPARLRPRRRGGHGARAVCGGGGGGRAAEGRWWVGGGRGMGLGGGAAARRAAGGWSWWESWRAEVLAAFHGLGFMGLALRSDTRVGLAWTDC